MIRFLRWFFRFCVFLVVVLFALKNTDTVRVVLFSDKWAFSISLVVVMLLCFLVGSLFSLLLVFTTTIRHKKEQSRLKKQVHFLEQQLKEKVPPTESDLIIPMHPL